MNNYMYILEGETEQKVINVLKEAGLIISGKVKVLNVLTKNVASIARSIKPSTNLYAKLDEKGFDIEKLWIKEGFSGISQDSEKIKIK